MKDKGRTFTGALGGANYERWAALFGMGQSFYRRALGNVVLEPGMKAVDLGCGPGALSFALAERSSPSGKIVGVDLSEDQLHRAREVCSHYGCDLSFSRCSMDELPMKSCSIDLVMTSMALHVTPPSVRRSTIAEVARVLKPGGRFLLIDWSRPKFGLQGIIWYPFCRWGERNRDNWNNVYPEICRRQGLVLTSDRYVNSIVRRQMFRKKS